MQTIHQQVVTNYNMTANTIYTTYLRADSCICIHLTQLHADCCL